MILDLLERPTDRKIDLVFGTRRVEDLLYPEEFTRLAERFDNFRYFPCLSRFGDPDWTGLRGRVTVVLPRLFKDLDRHEVYVCGRQEMIAEAEKVLVQLGCAPEAIHREGGG
jgi:CDP-4-dehydro-6-deoxyglucose reductase